MIDYEICPSLLAADFANLGRELDAVLKAGADRIHVDVMDNHFVPNLTIGPDVCRALHLYQPLASLDVHLMITPVENMIMPFIKAGASRILFHPETATDVLSTINIICQNNCRAGLVFNPKSSYEILTDEILEKLECILVMLVNPGFGGQKLISTTLDNITYVCQRIGQNSHIHLMVDGGVNLTNLATIAKKGANSFVAGSAIFGSDDYQQTIQAMRHILNELDLAKSLD